MGKSNVLDKKYEELQKAIQGLHDKWTEQTNDVTVSGLEKASMGTSPLIPQLELTIDLKQYKGFIEELLQLISQDKEELVGASKKISDILSADLLQKWFNETVTVNQFYFINFAKENELPEWLPIFVAEYAARPYLQNAAAQLSEPLKSVKNSNACPCCGEPARLALVAKNGGKEMTCPRCLHKWDVKKISCAHCGTEGDLVVLRVEGEDASEVHACNKCKGYTKVIDTRKFIKKESPTLLDVKHIHLDYVAQEKGYGIQEETKAH